LRDELIEKWSANQHLVEGDDGEDSHEPVPPPASPIVAADFTDFDSYDHDDGEGPTSQLLTEYWTSFSANNEEESFVQIPPAHSVYAPSSASFQENNLDESSVRIPAADSMRAPPYESFLANNQDDPFVHISTPDNGHNSPDAITFSVITPPQSSKDVSLPLESSEGIDESNIRGIYVVIGGLAGHERELLILSKSRGRLIINLNARKTRRKL
jgi:hypothetical protein